MEIKVGQEEENEINFLALLIQYISWPTYFLSRFEYQFLRHQEDNPLQELGARWIQQINFWNRMPMSTASLVFLSYFSFLWDIFMRGSVKAMLVSQR